MSEDLRSLDIFNSPFAAQVSLTRHNGQKLIWGFDPRVGNHILLTNHRAKSEESAIVELGLKELVARIDNKYNQWARTLSNGKNVTLTDYIDTDLGPVELVVDDDRKTQVAAALEKIYGFPEKPAAPTTNWGQVFNTVAGALLGRKSTPSE